MGGGWFIINHFHWCDGGGDEFFPEKIVSIKGRTIIVLGKSWVGWQDDEGKVNYTDEKQEMWLSILLDEEEDPKKLKETITKRGQEEALLLLEKMAWEEANF